MIESELTELIQKAAAELKAAGAREVYVFGSAAKGTMREDSDVDLAVSGLPPEAFFRAMAAAHDALGHSLDLLDLDSDSELARYLRNKGKLLRVG